MDLHSLLENMGLVDAFAASLGSEVGIHEPCCDDPGCSASCSQGCSAGSSSGT